MLEFTVLGRLRVLVDNEEVPIDDPVDRAFLTGLLHHPNRPVWPLSLVVEHWRQPLPLPTDLPARMAESVDRLRRLVDTLPGTTRLVGGPAECRLEVDEQLIGHPSGQAVHESQGQPSAGTVVTAEVHGESSVTLRTELASPRDLGVSRSTVSRIGGDRPLSDKAREAVQRAVEQLGYTGPTRTSTLAVSMYLSDESAHPAVESAVEAMLTAAGLSVVEREDPVLGSWFRRLRASELGAVAAHAADSRLVLGQDAHVTATMMQNLGPVLEAVQSSKEAVLRIGALLIVKLGDQLAVHQLTAAQQLQLDHQPQLALAPHEILTALRIETRPGLAPSGQS